MNILIVEDEDPKANALIAYLTEYFPLSKIRMARSVRSAIDEIMSNAPKLMLLDMSLPTFDAAEGRQGGRPQGFGGREVLRELDRRKLNIDVIVVTGYKAFLDKGKEVNLGKLEEELRNKHPKNFREIIFFESQSKSWNQNLAQCLVRLYGEEK